MNPRKLSKYSLRGLSVSPTGTVTRDLGAFLRSDKGRETLERMQRVTAPRQGNTRHE